MTKSRQCADDVAHAACMNGIHAQAENADILAGHHCHGSCMTGVVMQATNRRTLGAMVKELSKGGKLVWIAPSGGRDRPDSESGEWLPHRYDPGMHRYAVIDSQVPNINHAGSCDSSAADLSLFSP